MSKQNNSLLQIAEYLKNERKKQKHSGQNYDEYSINSILFPFPHPTIHMHVDLHARVRAHAHSLS